MFKTLTGLAASSLLLLGAHTAFAADLYNSGPRVSLKDDTPAPYRSCSGDRFAGSYVGATAGSTDQHARWEETSNDFGGSFLGDPQSTRHSAFTGGITAGYNHVRCNFLVGVEGDFNFTDIGGTTYYTPPQQALYPNIPLGQAGITNRLHDFATLRARMGFVAGRTLLYATGGFAWGDLKHQLIDINHYDGGNQNPSFDGWKLGWTVGGGIEQALTDRVSLKGEALYMDFGTRNYGLIDSSSQRDPYTFSNRASAVTARVGLNIKLGDWGHGCDDCGHDPMK